MQDSLGLVVASISVTTQPTKTSYLAGESFDPTGMVVTATYSNGTSGVVTGYTYSPSGALSASDEAITISYGGKSTSVSITVVDVGLNVVGATDDDGDLFGKVASDLQENIVVGESAITGTLKYISDYSSAFSGAEAYGNYIAIKCTASAGAVIKAEVVGGLHGEVTLDPDGLLVARIASNTQSIRVSATVDGMTETKVYALNNLVLTLNDDKSVTSVTVEGVSATKDGNDDWAVTLPNSTTAIDEVAVVLNAPNADYTLTPESFSDLVPGDIKTFNLRVVAQDGSHANYQVVCTIAE